MPASAPRYAPPANLAWMDGAEHGQADRLFLTTVPDGNTVLLQGSARLIWLAAIRSADPVSEISEITGLAPEDVAPDVSEFLSDLLLKHFLTEASPGQ